MISTVQIKYQINALTTEIPVVSKLTFTLLGCYTLSTGKYIQTFGSNISITIY